MVPFGRTLTLLRRRPVDASSPAASRNGVPTIVEAQENAGHRLLVQVCRSHGGT